MAKAREKATTERIRTQLDKGIKVFCSRAHKKCFDFLNLKHSHEASRRCPQGEIYPLHSGCVDPFDFPKWGNSTVQFVVVGTTFVLSPDI